MSWGWFGYRPDMFGIRSWNMSWYFSKIWCFANFKYNVVIHHEKSTKRDHQSVGGVWWSRAFPRPHFLFFRCKRPVQHPTLCETTAPKSVAQQYQWLFKESFPEKVLDSDTRKGHPKKVALKWQWLLIKGCLKQVAQGRLLKKLLKHDHSKWYSKKVVHKGLLKWVHKTGYSKGFSQQIIQKW